jgi:hypothetical protein
VWSERSARKKRLLRAILFDSFRQSKLALGATHLGSVARNAVKATGKRQRARDD